MKNGECLALSLENRMWPVYIHTPDILLVNESPDIAYGERTEREKLKLHAIFIGISIVFGQVGMILGMLDPAILGFHSKDPSRSPESGSMLKMDY